jgi:excisionase family DNA binding protein
LEADDVAAILGMTTDWIYREVRAGRLPHLRLGRYVRFRPESIDSWLDARERGGRLRQGGRGG